MMTNLFSIFDPSIYMMSSAWLLPTLAMFSPIMIQNSKPNQIFKKITSMIFTELKTLSSSNTTASFLTPIFILILIFNLISMIPTMFTMNSQISIVFPMGLSLWLSIIMCALITKLNKFLSHLVPEGAPAALTPALVVIELISNIIRPITLSVRLIANMTAGHLLMHLLSEFVCYIFPYSPLMLPVSLILSLLEIMVSFIQAYIFCALLSLYSSEIH